MTRGFCTIVYFPYEGCMITEYPTKAEAVKAYNESVKDVGSDDPNVYLLGVALVNIEVIKEKGEWKEVINENILD